MTKKKTTSKKENTSSKIKTFLDDVVDSKSFTILKQLAFSEVKKQVTDKVDNLRKKIISHIEFLILITIGSIYLINGILKLLSTAIELPLFTLEIGLGLIAIIIGILLKKK